MSLWLLQKVEFALFFIKLELLLILKLNKVNGLNPGVSVIRVV